MKEPEWTSRAIRPLRSAPADRGAGTDGGFGCTTSSGLCTCRRQGASCLRPATRAARRLFPLDAALDGVEPALDADRGLPRHRVLYRPGPVEDFDDVYDNFYPQASSQWDSLAHVAYAPGVFYNGASAEDVLTGGRNTIDHWAKAGSPDGQCCSTSSAHSEPKAAPIPRTVPRPSPWQTSTGTPCRRRVVFGWLCGVDADWVSRVVPEPAVCRQAPSRTTADGARHRALRGDGSLLVGQPDRGGGSRHFCRRGLAPGLSAEAFPFGFLHRILIGQLGMALGELWSLDDLATDCADDGSTSASSRALRCTPVAASAHHQRSRHQIGGRRDENPTRQFGRRS